MRVLLGPMELEPKELLNSLSIAKRETLEDNTISTFLLSQKNSPSFFNLFCILQ